MLRYLLSRWLRPLWDAISLEDARVKELEREIRQLRRALASTQGAVGRLKRSLNEATASGLEDGADGGDGSLRSPPPPAPSSSPQEVGQPPGEEEAGHGATAPPPGSQVEGGADPLLQYPFYAAVKRGPPKNV